MTGGTGETIASLVSIGLGGVAVVTAIYGTGQDPLGTALHNRLRINVGDTGPLILTGTAVAVGLACAIIGLRRPQRRAAIMGIAVNGGALVLALLLKLAVEHGVGA